MTSLKDKIITALKESGMLDEKKLNDLLQKGEGSETELIRHLLDGEIIQEDDLLNLLSHELEIPPIDIARVKLEKKFMDLIPEKVIRQHNLIPLSKIGKYGMFQSL